MIVYEILGTDTDMLVVMFKGSEQYYVTLKMNRVDAIELAEKLKKAAING